MEFLAVHQLEYNNRVPMSESPVQPSTVDPLLVTAPHVAMRSLQSACHTHPITLI
jgi:hypothetical protein